MFWTLIRIISRGLFAVTSVINIVSTAPCTFQLRGSCKDRSGDAPPAQPSAARFFSFTKSQPAVLLRSFQLSSTKWFALTKSRTPA
ncbi:hypothetical protein PLICRDRAFT_291747 [Plicaturopsis crispa FD-325 SS-3]|nr:hypothetical protein PLICRDRAFT_291747 [Plicaturopsis crispa FD-325 SS-3]